MIYSYAPFLFKGDMMKKENIWLIISILLVIIWMVSVFKLSGEVSEVSGNRSGGVISSIIKMFNSDISEEKLDNLTKELQPIIRKIAHFLLYSLGGFLIYNLIYIILRKYGYIKNIVISILCGVFYAITDEIHQLFVPGRSGEIRDVFIDTLGVIFGTLMYYLIISFLVKRIFNQKSKIMSTNADKNMNVI